jgi:dihydroorotate dehydrogenase
MNALVKYDPTQSYQWNFDNAPEPADIDVPPFPGTWQFAGRDVASPLGIPAGPLLNGRWCLYYASLGFDFLTYKTVRSVERECYQLPNLQPVICGQLCGDEDRLVSADTMQGSWAVSFGMPSKSPEYWRKDIEATRRQLSQDKLLSVSVVGTIQEGWSIDQLAKDYADCARWAVESGADCIETNFSCPNVSTCDGQLFQNPKEASLVAAEVREAIGQTPFLVKVGHVNSSDEAAQLLAALSPYISGLSMTNSVAVTVADKSEQLFFDGQPRGICGAAILDASVQQTELFAGLIQASKLGAELVGVGGISTAEHVQRYLAAGASSVHLATAAMTNPLVGLEIRRQLAANALST